MYDFVVVHGSYGSPFENWFPWLFSELSNEGKNVLAPQFPCGKGIQNYENWEKVLDSYSALIDENTTFIGHSLAPAFIVDYILSRKIKVNKLVFAAPFYGLIDIPDFDEVNSPFFFMENLDLITEYSKDRICFISDNDPYVPNQLSVDFAKKIQGKIKTVNKAGHFNTSSGFSEFELLLNELK